MPFRPYISISCSPARVSPKLSRRAATPTCKHNRHSNQHLVQSSALFAQQSMTVTSTCSDCSYQALHAIACPSMLWCCFPSQLVFYESKLDLYSAKNCKGQQVWARKHGPAGSTAHLLSLLLQQLRVSSSSVLHGVGQAASPAQLRGRGHRVWGDTCRQTAPHTTCISVSTHVSPVCAHDMQQPPVAA